MCGLVVFCILIPLFQILLMVLSETGTCALSIFGKSRNTLLVISPSLYQLWIYFFHNVYTEMSTLWCYKDFLPIFNIFDPFWGLLGKKSVIFAHFSQFSPFFVILHFQNYFCHIKTFYFYFSLLKTLVDSMFYQFLKLNGNFKHCFCEPCFCEP